MEELENQGEQGYCKCLIGTQGLSPKSTLLTRPVQSEDIYVNLVAMNEAINSFIQQPIYYIVEDSKKNYSRVENYGKETLILLPSPHHQGPI